MPGFGGDVIEIVEGLWRAVFDVPVVSADPARIVGQRATAWAGVVHLSGAWNGSVAIQCPESLVRRMAASSLGGGGLNPSPDQQRRALGELTRMLAEALKILLPEPCRLSAPETVVDTAFRLRLPAAAPVLQSVFCDAEEVFSVTIFQRLTAETTR